MFLAFDPDRQAVREWGHFEFDCACFILSISRVENPESRRAAVLTSPYDLKRYVATAEALTIHKAQLLSPAELNGQGEWCLNDLLEITHATDPHSSAEGMIYTTSEGTYIDSKIAGIDGLSKRVLYSNEPQPIDLFGPDSWSPFAPVHETLQNILDLASTP